MRWGPQLQIEKKTCVPVRGVAEVHFATLMLTFACPEEETFMGSAFYILRWSPLVLYQFVKSQRKGMRIHLRFQQMSLFLFFSHNPYQGYALVKVETNMSMRQRFQARTHLEQIFDEKKMRKPHPCTLEQLAPVGISSVPYPSHSNIHDLMKTISPSYQKQVGDILETYIPNVLLKKICEYLELDWLIVEGNRRKEDACSSRLVFAFCLQWMSFKENLFIVKWFRNCSGIHSLKKVENLLNGTNDRPWCGCCTDEWKGENHGSSQRIWTHFKDPEIQSFFRSDFVLERCYALARPTE